MRPARPFRRASRDPGAPGPAVSASFASGTGVLMVGRYVVAAMGWTGTVLIVHALSPRAWGGFSLIFAVLNLVSLVSSLRLGRAVTADILEAGDEAGAVVGSFVTMRLLLGLVVYGLSMVVMAGLGYPAVVLEGAAVAGFGLLFAAPSAALDVLFMTKRWMRSMAVASVLGQAAQLVAIIALVATGTHSLVVLAAPALLYDGVALVWKSTALRRQMRVPVPTVDWTRWRRWFREAVPLSIGAALNTAYMRVDTVMVSKLVGLTAVGNYAIGYKFADLIGFFPTALSAALLASLTGAWGRDPEAFRAHFRRAFLIVTVVAVATAVEFGVFATPLIRLFYGSRYAVAGRAAQGLVLGELFGYYTALCFTALAAVNRNVAYPLAALVGLVLNVGLNLALVPVWSYNGAALATVLTEVVVLAILARATSRIPGIGAIPWDSTVRTAAAALPMAATALVVRLWAPWPVAAVVAAFAYACGLHLLRVGGPAGLRELVT